MALSVLAIEEATGNYVYYSMGGLPALHYSADKVSSVASRGTLLGNVDFSVGVKEGTLQMGDRVMLYTDGIPEIEMANGRQVGMRRFTGEYKRSIEMPLSQAAKEMVDFALRVDTAEMQDDDWTFAMIKWDGIGRSASPRDNTFSKPQQ
jgi:serine phosphatase RsbU (regulator of sigma subunit)